VVEICGSEAERNQLADAVPLDRRSVAARAQYLDVASAELRGFEDRLAAAAARRADGRVASANDGDSSHLGEAELVLRGGKRALLGADAEAVAGVLHVRAGYDLAVRRFDGAADAESGIRRISLRGGRAGKRDEFILCHALVSSRLQGACASQPNLGVSASMKCRLLVAAFLAAAALPSPALAWGKTGHRVVAAIADTQLSGLARAHIREILGPGESLVDAANWPDEMRSAPGKFWQKTATPWHYVTLNGIVYDHAPPEGDALEALEHFRKVLQDPKADLADKQMALRFIIHIVGDLHQPLHVGKCCDRGGNDVKVTFFGKPTNLHGVWDSQLVDEEQLSYSELAEKLERHLSDRQLIKWWDINPRDWISESGEYRDTLYPTAADTPRPRKDDDPKKADAPPLPDLSYSYVYRFTPLMEQRLTQGGVRLAAYLNAIFAEPQPLPKRPAR